MSTSDGQASPLGGLVLARAAGRGWSLSELAQRAAEAGSTLSLGELHALVTGPSAPPLTPGTMCALVSVLEIPCEEFLAALLVSMGHHIPDGFREAV